MTSNSDCSQALVTVASALSFFGGIVINEITHYLRAFFEDRKKRKTAIETAEMEIQFVAQRIEGLTYRYAQILGQFSAGVKLDRTIPRYGISSESLEKTKLQMIETGAPQQLIASVNSCINSIEDVESVRDDAVKLIDRVVASYSKQHNQYEEYVPSLRRLNELQIALSVANSVFPDAISAFTEYRTNTNFVVDNPN